MVAAVIVGFKLPGVGISGGAGDVSGLRLPARRHLGCRVPGAVSVGMCLAKVIEEKGARADDVIS